MELNGDSVFKGNIHVSISLFLLVLILTPFLFKENKIHDPYLFLWIMYCVTLKIYSNLNERA